VAAGVKARVLIGDRDSGRLTVYDAGGAALRDLATELDLGAGIGDVLVLAEKEIAVFRGQAQARPDPLRKQPYGLVPPPERSYIVALGHRAGGGADRARVVTTAGERVAQDFDVPGVNSALGLSWNRRFLFASGQTPAVGGGVASADGVVVRIVDGSTIWQRTRLSQVAFGRDEAHLVSGDLAGAIEITDLGTGTSVAVVADRLGSIEGAAAQGVVFRRNGTTTEGNALYLVDWKAAASPFDRSFPPYGDDRLVLLREQGRSMVFRRWNNGYGAVDPMGYFQFDPVSLTSHKLTPEPAMFECLQDAPEPSYRMAGDVLRRCTCPSGACTDIATLPPPTEPGWVRGSSPSPGGRFVAVVADWPGSALPVGNPDMLLYAGDGRPLLALPYGRIEFDASSTLALVRGAATGGEYRIVDLETLRVTAVTVPNGFAAIVYE
jgi:hypothetical protein